MVAFSVLIYVWTVDGSVDEKMLAYNRANREVAILCNHQVTSLPLSQVPAHCCMQRAPPKSHEQQVEKMDTELEELRKEIKDLKKDLKQLKSEVRTSSFVTLFHSRFYSFLPPFLAALRMPGLLVLVVVFHND